MVICTVSEKYTLYAHLRYLTLIPFLACRLNFFPELTGYISKHFTTEFSEKEDIWFDSSQYVYRDYSILLESVTAHTVPDLAFRRNCFCP